jgi:hypothetical protein
MPRATITLESGATVEIEGTAEEVAELLSKFDSPRPSAETKRRRKKTSSRKPAAPRKTVSGGPQTLIRGLIDESFFSQKRTINEVQSELEQQGHIYPLNSLSTPLVRLVRARKLRRFKEKDQWVYVQP